MDLGIREMRERNSCADSCAINIKYTNNLFKTYEIKLKEGIYKKIQIEKNLLKVMEQLGEKRLAIKWIQVHFKNIQKHAKQLSLFEPSNEKLESCINQVQEKFPGKLLTFEQKIKF